ncbi:lytic transglycosylase domain-containing protein [Frateuria defendens]|uniref:lytic transglycosylase domain-containing protein n=1 Tax=Frateuria defendens TaxID=2219559 RepID=UPI001F1E5E20|nr:lytic transglycosylase domain-containing protein [Frateuria defendens]
MALGAVLWARAGHAASLYRCTGAGGEVVFSSSKAGYSDCRRLSVPDGAPIHRATFLPRPAAASLDRVVGSVETTARPLPPASGQRLFADVQASVETTARRLDALAPPLPAAPPGQWSYHESTAAIEPAAPAAPGGADRVLRGAVYRVVHADGSVEYTNVQPAGQRGRTVTMLFSYIATCMACNLHSPIDWNRTRLDFASFAEAIHAASTEFGVDESFLRAVIHAESAFNPRALSLKGAQGLMQLMPATASDMGVPDAFDPDQNIRGGARYLALLLKNFNGDERLATAAYNAGPAAVQRYRGVPPYAETQVYVERVGVLHRRYREAVRAAVAAAAVHGAVGAP